MVKADLFEKTVKQIRDEIMNMRKELHQLIRRNDEQIRDFFVVPGVCGYDKENQNPDMVPKYDSFRDFLADLNKISETNIQNIEDLQNQ